MLEILRFIGKTFFGCMLIAALSTLLRTAEYHEVKKVTFSETWTTLIMAGWFLYCASDFAIRTKKRG